MTAGTLFDFGSLLGPFQFQGRQVEDLAALKIQGGFLGEILAALTLPQRVNLDVLGSVAELQRAPGMAGLAARFAAGLLAQALGLGLLRTVRGGGARTVAAILMNFIVVSEAGPSSALPDRTLTPWQSCTTP